VLEAARQDDDGGDAERGGDAGGRQADAGEDELLVEKALLRWSIGRSRHA